MVMVVAVAVVYHRHCCGGCCIHGGRRRPRASRLGMNITPGGNSMDVRGRCDLRRCHVGRVCHTGSGDVDGCIRQP